VVVLGAAAAADLKMFEFDGQDAVLIDGIPFVVLGVIRSVQFDPTLLADAVIPDEVARTLWGPASTGSQMDIGVRPAAATQVEREVPPLLHPADPTRLAAATLVEAPIAQASVSSDLTGLLKVLTAAALFISVVGIGATMYTAVSERSFEIGLRRALGAHKLDITGQFLAESGLMGTLGGLIGTVVGLVAVVITSHLNGWLPVVSSEELFLAPLLGTVAGMIAGLAPAVRAGRLDPIEALRR
jgi:putative ABC transport system permease protein